MVDQGCQCHVVVNIVVAGRTMVAAAVVHRDEQPSEAPVQPVAMHRSVPWCHFTRWSAVERGGFDVHATIIIDFKRAALLVPDHRKEVRGLVVVVVVLVLVVVVVAATVLTVVVVVWLIRHSPHRPRTCSLVGASSLHRHTIHYTLYP